MFDFEFIQSHRSPTAKKLFANFWWLLSTAKSNPQATSGTSLASLCSSTGINYFIKVKNQPSKQQLLFRRHSHCQFERRGVHHYLISYVIWYEDVRGEWSRHSRTRQFNGTTQQQASIAAGIPDVLVLSISEMEDVIKQPIWRRGRHWYVQRYYWESHNDVWIESKGLLNSDLFYDETVLAPVVHYMKAISNMCIWYLCFKSTTHIGWYSADACIVESEEVRTPKREDWKEEEVSVVT